MTPTPRTPLRVLHGPVNVANQPWALSRAERRRGLSSDLIANYGTWLAYPSDRTISTYAEKSLVSRARRARFGLTAPFRYDVMHYYFGRSFMLWDDYGDALGKSDAGDRRMLSDVWLARRLGRRTFMTLQGCDIRQAGVNDQRYAVTMCREGACPAYATCIDSLDAARRAMSKHLLPLMDRVFYLNPDLGHATPNGTFLPYANVEIDKIRPLPARTSRRLRVVHAPSNTGIKGTSQILAALDRLRGHLDFELILVENKSHAEAMAIYEAADLAIDQVLAGWYGGFAVELMAMGKPVAAYIREEDRKFVPDAMWNEIPILRIDPRSLDADLEAILSQPGLVADAGARSRRYVERWHNPDVIAAALEVLYRNPTAPLDIAAHQGAR